MLDLSCCTAVQ